MDQNKIPHDPRHLEVLSGVAKMIFRAYGTFGANRAPILHQDYHYLQTSQDKLLFEPHHLGVPSGVSKMI